MRFRIAAVSFLNTRPLIHGLTDDHEPGVEVVTALPSALGGMLGRGEADVGLLPVVDIFAGGSGGIVGRSGIICHGAVDSVKVFARRPLGELTRIHADRGSHTSVALLRVLLAEGHGISPEMTVCAPEPDLLQGDAEAVLVIGDRCFAFERELRRRGDTAWRAHDLGALWREQTELPFVFAAWAVDAGFVARHGRQEVERLTEILVRARDSGLAALDAMAVSAAEEGKLGSGGEATADAIAYYWRHALRFDLDEAAQEGMRLFHRKCIAHGLVPDLPAPPIY